MSPVVRRLRLPLGVGVVALLVFSGFQLMTTGTKHGVAYFSSVTSVYPHDKVRIMGVPVGTIDKITPEAGRVRVDFSYSATYTLPADVRAAVVSPTLVATRYIQLAPAYAGGPEFPDDGTIPIERTASPLEFDDLKTELDRLATTLGPNDADTTGSLARFLRSAAAAGKGNGEAFNTMVTDLSDALGTLAEGRGDMFATVRNLQVFVSAIAEMDGQVSDFNRRLGDVSNLLDSNGDDLAAVIRKVDKAARRVETFVRSNRKGLTTATDRLGRLTGTLAEQRDNLATLLHVGPNTVTNFYNIFSWRMRSFTGGLMVDNLSTPGELACALISNQLAQEAAAQKSCMETLGPVLNQISVKELPIGVNGPLVGGGDYDQSSPTDDPSEGARPGTGGTPPGTGLPGLSGGLGDLLLPGGAR